MAKKKVKKVKNTKKDTGAKPINVNEFQPEWDAKTLADAATIKMDKTRLKKAQIASKKLIKEQQTQIDGLKRTLKGL